METRVFLYYQAIVYSCVILIRYYHCVCGLFIWGHTDIKSYLIRLLTLLTNRKLLKMHSHVNICCYNAKITQGLFEYNIISYLSWRYLLNFRMIWLKRKIVTVKVTVVAIWYHRLYMILFLISKNLQKCCRTKFDKVDYFYSAYFWR